MTFSDWADLHGVGLALGASLVVLAWGIVSWVRARRKADGPHPADAADDCACFPPPKYTRADFLRDAYDRGVPLREIVKRCRESDQWRNRSWPDLFNPRAKSLP